MAFVLHYPKVETAPRDLIAVLIAKGIRLVLMIISSGFKNQKVQKGGFSQFGKRRFQFVDHVARKEAVCEICMKFILPVSINRLSITVVLFLFNF